MSNSCLLKVYVNGKPSKLYDDLVRLTGNRLLANYIYAVYASTPGIAADMDNLGYKKNEEQDQHTARDVMEHLKVNQMKIDARKITSSKVKAGAVDSAGNTITYTNAKEALDKAQAFNESSEGLVASVVQTPSGFNINVEEKNSITQRKLSQTSDALAIWNTLEQVFRSAGIDLSEVAKNNSSLVNATISIDLPRYFISLQNSNHRYLQKKDIQVLLSMIEGSTQLTRLKQKFGTLEEVVQAIYDSFRGGTVSSSEASLITTALNLAQRFGGIDLNALNNDILTNLTNIRMSDENFLVKQFLEELNKKYNINAAEIKIASGEIKSLQDAVQRAIYMLNSQLKDLTYTGTDVNKEREVRDTIDSLIKSLSSNKYYYGALQFLSNAANAANEFDAIVRGIGSIPKDDVVRIGNEIHKAKDLLECYSGILAALANIDNLVTSEFISSTDMETVKKEANKVLEIFKNRERYIKELSTDTITTAVTQVFGDSISEGVSTADVVGDICKDASVFDYIYAMTRVSQPLVATMGKIIRDAQDRRLAVMAEYSRRIREATDKLYKSGSNTDFMFETIDDEVYIVSDIDWEKYNAARARKYYAYKAEGYRGMELESLMKDWEDSNTELRVVDSVSNRKEKVPNSTYRKEFPQLTYEQQEYYDTIMQIKGELGTLLPEKARFQYRPPQVHGTFIDALSRAKSPKDVWRAIKNRIKWIVEQKEDDEDFANQAVLDGENITLAEGTIQGTVKKRIPIFYVRSIKHQEELMRDFSGALSRFAASAIKYDSLQKIEGSVNFMADYIHGQEALNTNSDGSSNAEVIESRGLRLFKKLKKKSSRMGEIADNIISQQLYLERVKNPNKFSKFIRSIINYTSMNALSFNIKGAFSNYFVGELNMIIEAGAKEFYSLSDLIWAHKKLLKYNSIDAPGRLVDLATNSESNYDDLLTDLFDPTENRFDNLGYKRFHKGPRKFFQEFLPSYGYELGENFLHYMGMYAILHRTKVTIDGEEATLYDAFTKEDSSGNPKLVLKDNVYDVEGNPVNDAYIDKIRKRIRLANQQAHGALTAEDKGAIENSIAVQLIMNLRKWMVEFYSKRFRKEYTDASTGIKRAGYWYTMYQLSKGLASSILGMQLKDAITWSERNEMQKANTRRAISDLVLDAALYLIAAALGEPDDHKREFWTRMAIYQVKKGILDVNAGNPLGFAYNINTVIQSPIASTRTMNGFIYLFMGLFNGDLFDEVQRGPDAGENKYWHNVKKYTIPFYGQIKSTLDFDEQSGAFNALKPSPSGR